MSETLKIDAAKAAPRIGDGLFWAATAGLVFLAYFTVFHVFNAGTPASSAMASLRNLASLLPPAWAATALMRRFVLDRSLARQVALHMALAVAFTLCWYWLLMVAIGLSEGDSPLRFSVKPFFPSPASAWQLLQGLAVYGFLASTIHARARPDFPRLHLREERGVQEDEARQGKSRYFIRAGEVIRPVDFDEIITIAGADDYAEVTTATGRHLAKMTLAEFEAALDPARFLRVHRSTIVNVERIERAEPAGGGRMLVHMTNGETIQASRTGSRLLRGRVL